MRTTTLGFAPLLIMPETTILRDVASAIMKRMQSPRLLPKHTIKLLLRQSVALLNIYLALIIYCQQLTHAEKAKTKAVSSMAFFFNLEENVIALQNELMWQTYRMSPYHHFYVFEPKRRLICAPNFRDRVIHRAIINAVEPKIDKSFIHNSYACRKGKGTHAGVNKAQWFIRVVENKNGKAYALKADIHHYFSSIDHPSVKKLIKN